MLSIANLPICSTDSKPIQQPDYWSRRRQWWRVQSHKARTDWIGIARAILEIEDLDRSDGGGHAAVALVAERGVPSAAALQRFYEGAIKRRAADRLPKTTTDAIDYLLKHNDSERLNKFLEGRPKTEVEKILAYIQRKSS